jgi:hypothetical protein
MAHAGSWLHDSVSNKLPTHTSEGATSRLRDPKSRILDHEIIGHSGDTQGARDALRRCSGTPTPPVHTPGRGERYSFQTALLGTFSLLAGQSSPSFRSITTPNLRLLLCCKAPLQGDAAKLGKLQERCPNRQTSWVYFSRSFKQSPVIFKLFAVRIKVRGNETLRWIGQKVGKRNVIF